MTKVVFVSRHDMTSEQVADLRKFLKLDDRAKLVVEKANITFNASDDRKLDIIANKNILKSMFGEYDAVVGVFPPVAIEALAAIRDELTANPALGNAEDVAFIAPVSRQKAEERADGTRQLAFEHVRYAYL